ncbi:MAG: PAS domain S-box protein [Gallionella sp.]|nr:PAS domain S-box protein [Gallionella sp.]
MTPARVVIAVGLIVLVAELLIMALIESFPDSILKDSFLKKLFIFLDPILLTAIVSPALYFLVFKPLNRQAELKHAEASLRKLSQAVEQNPSSIVITDLDANIEYVNEAFVKETGYSLAEVVGQNQRILHSGKNAQSSYDDMWAHLTRGEVWEGEFINRRKDGSEYIDRELNSPIRADDGCITNYLGIKEDITERKRVEELLKNMAAKYHAVFESSSDAIMLLGEEYFFDCNPATLRMFGCPTRDDFIRKHPARRSPPTQPGGEDSARLLNQHIATAFKNGSNRFEWMYRRLDGTEFFADVLMTAMELDGKPVLQATVRDITQRKQAQEALRLSHEHLHRLLNSMTEGAYGVDTHGDCTFVNHAFLQMLGYRNENEVLGKHMHELIHYAHADGSPYPAEECRAYRAYRINQPVNVFDEVFWRKDGIAIPVEYYSNPIETDGLVIGAIVTFVDITARKQAEAMVLQLNDELENKVTARTADLEQAMLEAEQANRAKSEFLATMSHEIRTPMNGVIGMVDVLQQSSLNDPQIEMANIIHDSAFALLTIIDDILDFSKIEAGKLLIESVPMSVADVVEGACETMDHMAEKKGVELTLFTDPSIPSQVMGDPGRLRQILLNLNSNAIKFSSGQQRQGKVSVRTLLIESTPEQILLEFRVTDNGIGMDKEAQVRLFTPFSQADSTTTRNYGGTGLGLAISRRLVNIKGGEITVQSEPGKGSIFTVRLPFKLPMDVGRVLTRHDDGVGLKPDLQNPVQVTDLPCLVVGGVGGLADDLAAYLKHAGALVERVEDLSSVKRWVAQHPPGLCIVLIDTAAENPPLDELRAAARAHPEHKIRFVVIRRGQRRESRLEDADLVLVDGNVLTRRALLKAVAVAAGWAKPTELKDLPNDVKATLAPLPREEAQRQGTLILVAEDNEINQKVILQQLRLLGRTADIASDGREALERWQSGDYGLLFTDLHMPEMDGYELTTAIRIAEKSAANKISKPRIPIIAITANALKGEADHCRAIGMDDYLSKPVQLVNLKAMLEKWMPAVAYDPIPGDTASTGVLPYAPTILAHVGAYGNTPSVAEKPSPSSAPVDVNVLKALIGNDEAMIREFLHDFRISAAKIAAELRAACAAGQAAAAGALAHKLKSSSRSVGALALGELSAAMEQSGKAADTTELAALLPKFEQELADIDVFLDGY